MLFQGTWMLFGGLVGVRAASSSASTPGISPPKFSNSSLSTPPISSAASTNSFPTITSSVALGNASIPSNRMFNTSANSSTTLGPWDALLQNYTGPVNGSGTDFARSCNAAKLGYVRQSSLRNPSPTMSYYTSVSVRTDKPGVWGTWFATGALPTQCDGYPRFNITTSEDYTLTTTKYSTTTYTLSTDIGNWTYPHLAITRPTCTINPSDCAQLVSDYQSAWDSQDASFAASQQAIVSLANPPSAVVVNGKTSELPLITPAPAITVHGDVYTPLVGASGVTYNLSKAFNYYDDLLLTPGGERTVIYDTMYQLSFRPVPQCSWSDELSFKSSSCSHTAKCTIAAYDVELIYFAPPATSRDLCATTDPLFNRKIVTHYSHPHESVVLNETITLWSDSAYVKYRSISAGRPCQGGQVGATHEGSIVAIPSSDISSMCGWQWTTATGSLPVRITLGVTPYPFNFGDLVGSVPQSAYQCMPECNPWLGTNDCDTIIPSLYSPRLAVPRQVRSIDPAWAECELDWDGSRDPPTAVGSAQVVADPTSVEPTASPPPQTGVAPSRLAQNTSPTTPEPVNGSKPSDPGSNPTKVGPGSGADPSQDDPSDPTDGADPVQNPNPAPPNNDPGKTDAPAQNPPAVTPVPIITIGDSTINNDPTNPGAIILNPSETLSEGDPGTVISGTTISVGPGNNLIIGDSSTVQTIAIPTFNPDNNAGPAPVTLTSINNTPIIITYPDPTSGNDPSAIIIGPSRANNNNNNDNDDGVPLSPGSSTIIDGTTLLFAPSTGLVVAHDGTTSTLLLPAPTPPTSSPTTFLTLPDGTPLILDPATPSVLTLGSQTITLDASHTFSTVLGSETIVWDPSRGLVVSDATATRVVPVHAPVPSAWDEMTQLMMSVFGAAAAAAGSVAEMHITTTTVQSSFGDETRTGARTVAETGGAARTTGSGDGDGDGDGARPTGAAGRLIGSGWNGGLGSLACGLSVMFVWW